ncbi:TIM barrel protein [Acetobacterium paludosum]|uniref:TIM barrel protein n=2 Tax=Acetobacterium paludosum TaxID=52693 RepID=A0A923KTZ5_9FIRM|nr:TIM barrel protein [Acetobacterium paludosum]
MYLMNISNYSGDLEKFQKDWKNVECFLEKHQLDGVELICYNEEYLETLPRHILKGLHLKYFPTWLEFYKNNHEKVCEMFGGIEGVRQYYGGIHPETLKEAFRNEYQRAQEFGVEYMVYHVSHVTTEHSFTRAFDYTDDDVLDATVELVNQAFDRNSDVMLLFENLWWPGLTLLDKEKAQRFLARINYKNKGIMLDLSHLMITNPKLKTAGEAAEYIIETIEKLGSLKEWIKGIHVNLSLPGDYLTADHQSEYAEILKTEDQFERYIKTVGHIKKIDWHVPFDHPLVKNIIDLIEPEYVVFELQTQNLQQLDDYINIQNKAIGRL